LVFSIEPRCQGLCGSQKKALIPIPGDGLGLRIPVLLGRG
jgi:hypothetical protein